MVRGGDVRDFDKILADYLAVINHDDRSGKRFLFGHSMSTAMAVAIAGRVRDLSGIVLVNPPLRRKSSAGMTPTTGEYIKYALYYIFRAAHTDREYGGRPQADQKCRRTERGGRERR